MLTVAFVQEDVRGIEYVRLSCEELIMSHVCPAEERNMLTWSAGYVAIAFVVRVDPDISIASPVPLWQSVYI
jgi:hypothetical protein